MQPAITGCILIYTGPNAARGEEENRLFHSSQEVDACMERESVGSVNLNGCNRESTVAAVRNVQGRKRPERIILFILLQMTDWDRYVEMAHGQRCLSGYLPFGYIQLHTCSMHGHIAQ